MVLEAMIGIILEGVREGASRILLILCFLVSMLVTQCACLVKIHRVARLSFCTSLYLCYTSIKFIKREKKGKGKEMQEHFQQFQF